MRLSQTRSSSASAPGPAHLDLAERAHVDDADALAYRLVLGGDEVVVRRTRPAEPALVLAGAPPGLARVEVVGALPAVLRAEDRAGLLQAPVQRAQPLWASCLARRRTDSAAGSSTCRPRARPPPRTGRRGTGRRSATAGRLGRRPRLSPVDDQLGDAPCRARPRRRSRSATGRPPSRTRARPAPGRAAGCRRASSRPDGPRAPTTPASSRNGKRLHGAVHQLREARRDPAERDGSRAPRARRRAQRPPGPARSRRT